MAVNGTPIDITGYTFKFAAKTYLGQAAPVFEVDGDIDDGPAGEFSFDFTDAVTGLDPFTGIYEIAMVDDTAQKTTLTDPGGATFCLVQKIVSVT